MTDSATLPVVPSAGGFAAVVRLASLQAVILLALFMVSGWLETGRQSALASPEIWRHLSVGNWILANHAAPHNLVLSQSASLPWVDSSWLFDVLTAGFVRVAGIRGLPLLAVFFQFAIAVALFVLARGARSAFWSGAILTAVVLWLFNGLPLRSSLASVLLFILAMILIARSRSAGGTRTLYWMPLLFLVWANLDIQFVYGLAALVLYLMAEALGRLALRSGWRGPGSLTPEAPVTTVAAATAAGFVATLCTPYGYLLWGAALRSVSLFAADFYIPEMHALRFRQPHDYVLVLLVMTAFFAIGRRHARDLFSLLLLTACSIVSFHLQRDAWLVAVAVVVILSCTLDAVAAEVDRTSESCPWVLPAAAVVALLMLIAVFFARVPASPDDLLARVNSKFPVRAANYIRQSQLPQPLFNAYDFGSFLTWYLPDYPVAIDSRSDGYGEDLTLEYFKLTTAQVPIARDPALSRANTILLEADSEMGKALSIMPGYKRVYLDDQAMVLVREN